MGSLTHYVNSRFRNPDNRRRIYLGAFLVLAVAGVYAGLNEWFPHYGNHYGLWSLAPPFVPIILSFWTREVVSSLFLVLCLVDRKCTRLISSHVALSYAFLC